MRKSKIVSSIMSTVLLFTFCMSGVKPITASAQDQLSTLKSRQAELNQKNDEVKSKINSLKNDMDKKKEYVDSIFEQIENLQNQIDLENEKIEQINSMIREKNNNIESIQRDIDEKSEEFGKRLSAIYKSEDTTLLDVVLKAKDFKDLLDKTEIVSLVAKQDQELVNGLNNSIKSIEEEKKQIEESKLEVSRSKSNLDEKKAELVTIEKENQVVIDEIKNEMYEANSEMSAILKEKEKVEDEIGNFQKQSSASSKIVRRGSGRYCWPVPGHTIISSPFGANRGSYRHRGVDITGSGVYGAPIVAACSGVVTKSEYHSSYGNYVMIDHGSGYATLYAHCSRLAVSVGQEVKAGQVIGYVGNTGHSFGAHLHFETLKDGTRYNPTQELF